MSHAQSIWILITATLVGITTDSLADNETPPKFKITTKRDTDKVEVKAEHDKTVVSVSSPFGISQATIERTGDKWPDAVLLRLHLQGLESFRVSNGKVTLDASVSSTTNPPRVRVWKDGQENTPLDSTNPNWLEIRLLNRNGQPIKSIPLKEGHFEISLPKSLFEGNPKSITLHWIDFNRN